MYLKLSAASGLPMQMRDYCSGPRTGPEVVTKLREHESNRRSLKLALDSGTTVHCNVIPDIAD